MKILKIMAFAMCLSIFPLSAWAHSDHGSFDLITETQAVTKSEQLVKDLVLSEQLESSWKEVKGSSATSQNTSRGPVWRVSFMNPKAADGKKSTLYVFLDEFGNPISAGYEEALK